MQGTENINLIHKRYCVDGGRVVPELKRGFLEGCLAGCIVMVIYMLE